MNCKTDRCYLRALRRHNCIERGARFWRVVLQPVPRQPWCAESTIGLRRRFRRYQSARYRLRPLVQTESRAPPRLAPQRFHCCFRGRLCSAGHRRHRLLRHANGSPRCRQWEYRPLRRDLRNSCAKCEFCPSPTSDRAAQNITQYFLVPTLPSRSFDHPAYLYDAGQIYFSASPGG